MYLINDFFDEAISSLRKLDEAIFLRSPFYEDLNDIERITTKLKDLVDHFFSQNNIVVERNGVEVFENQLLAQIEFYVYSLAPGAEVVPEPEAYAGQAQAVATGGSIGLALVTIRRGEVVIIHVHQDS